MADTIINIKIVNIKFQLREDVFRFDILTH